QTVSLAEKTRHYTTAWLPAHGDKVELPEPVSIVYHGRSLANSLEHAALIHLKHGDCHEIGTLIRRLRIPIKGIPV
ncbi:MAG: hypothetical protein Q7K29_02270, partial [Thermoleophilia bacterium]|nr:hypothetical protein [Thermoleophilia bacterium]